MQTYFQMASEEKVEIKIFVVIPEWVFHLLCHLW